MTSSSPNRAAMWSRSAPVISRRTSRSVVSTTILVMLLPGETIAGSGSPTSPRPRFGDMKERAMKDTWYQARRKVVTFARKLQAERLVYSTAGNISMRVPGHPQLLAVTPTSMQYDLLEPEDIPIVSVDGELVDGRTRP